MKNNRKLKKKPVIILILSLVLIVIITLFLVFKDSFFKKDEQPKSLEKEKTISLSMLVSGNVLLDQNMIKDGLAQENKYNFDYLFKNVDKLKNKYDLKYYNQESIIGGSTLGYSANNKYNAPTEIGDTMMSLGFNLVSLSNLHSFDKGEVGIKNSLDYFKSKDILYSGQNSDEKSNIPINKTKGIKYTLLSYTMDTLVSIPKGKEYLLNIYNKDRVKDDINRIKEDVDLIIVSISWNNMKNSDLIGEQTEISNYLSSLGVDILIGNGLYSIQPIDKVNDMLVIYSSGNLLSNTSIVDSDTSMLTTFDINFKLEKDKTISHTYDNITSTLLYTSSNKGLNFKIEEYSKLKDTTLNNYMDYYNKYSNIIKSKIDVKIEK